MRNVITLIFLLSVGCTQVEPKRYPVSLRISTDILDDGSSAADFAGDLLEGAERWKDLGGDLVLDDAAHMVFQCATWNMDSAAATTNAGGIAVDCLYLFGLKPAWRSQLLAHELGHAFGLQHVEDPNATMYYQVNGADRLSPEDVTEFERTRPVLP